MTDKEAMTAFREDGEFKKPKDVLKMHIDGQWTRLARLIDEYLGQTGPIPLPTDQFIYADNKQRLEGNGYRVIDKGGSLWLFYAPLTDPSYEAYRTKGIEMYQRRHANQKRDMYMHSHAFDCQCK